MYAKSNPWFPIYSFRTSTRYICVYLTKHKIALTSFSDVKRLTWRTYLKIMASFCWTHCILHEDTFFLFQTDFVARTDRRSCTGSLCLISTKNTLISFNKISFWIRKIRFSTIWYFENYICPRRLAVPYRYTIYVTCFMLHVFRMKCTSVQECIELLPFQSHIKFVVFFPSYTARHKNQIHRCYEWIALPSCPWQSYKCIYCTRERESSRVPCTSQLQTHEMLRNVVVDLANKQIWRRWFVV